MKDDTDEKYRNAELYKQACDEVLIPRGKGGGTRVEFDENGCCYSFLKARQVKHKKEV